MYHNVYTAAHDVYHIDAIHIDKIKIGDTMPLYIKTAIAAQLQRAGLKQSDLATGANLTPQEVHDIGSALSDPLLSTLQKVSGFFGVSVGSLLENRQCQSMNIKIGDNTTIDIKVGGDWIVSTGQSPQQHGKQGLTDQPTVYDITQYLYCPHCQYPGHPKVQRQNDHNYFVCPHCGAGMEPMETIDNKE